VLTLVVSLVMSVYLSFSLPHLCSSLCSCTCSFSVAILVYICPWLCPWSLSVFVLVLIPVVVLNLVIVFFIALFWTWRHHIKAFEAFYIRCLQGILGLRCWHKVRHVEIRHRANINSMEYIVMQRQLRWLGHVIRMPSNRLPLYVLYGEHLHGSRSQGGQKKRFSDHTKATLKKWHIPADELNSGRREIHMARHLQGWSICFHDWVQPGCRRSPYSQTRNCRHNSKRSVLSHLQQSLHFWLWSSKSSPECANSYLCLRSGDTSNY